MRDTARFFRVLADEARLRMLWLLFNRQELCVCDVMAALLAMAVGVGTGYVFPGIVPLLDRASTSTPARTWRSSPCSRAACSRPRAPHAEPARPTKGPVASTHGPA